VAIPPLYAGLAALPNDYERVFVATYREAKPQSANPADIPFTLAQLVYHGTELFNHGINGVLIANFPDALYTFRARADLPAEILADGNFAIVGRGKGRYAFVRIPVPNRFVFPAPIPTMQLPDQTLAWVRPYMSNDEQGMLTRIQANDLIAKYLNLPSTFRLQSHLRMSVKGYGQVEVDELYVGRTAVGVNVGIAVEAKNQAPDDCLNVSQLFGTAQALQQLFPPNMPKHLIGAKPDTSGRICLAEFAIANHPSGLTQIRDWCAYELI
jgi:hypothetical protein